MSRFITHIAYAGAEYTPTLFFSDTSTSTPLDTVIGMSFDLTQRSCIGWHDLETGDNHLCPEAAVVDKKFDTCPACQRRTGFNPAFYHANTVSAKQEARNAEPHHLYLAYMGKDYIKVGISWAKRDNRRLLDQGARAGLILETFPTALIARQYEAKIARLEGIHETTLVKTKLALLAHPFNQVAAADALLATKKYIEATLGTTFSGSDVTVFDTHYSHSSIPHGAITLMSEPRITGTVRALVGDILLTEHEGRTLALPLKQYTGYPVNITDTPLSLDLEPQQMQLF